MVLAGAHPLQPLLRSVEGVLGHLQAAHLAALERHDLPPQDRSVVARVLGLVAPAAEFRVAGPHDEPHRVLGHGLEPRVLGERVGLAESDGGHPLAVHAAAHTQVPVGSAVLEVPVDAPADGAGMGPVFVGIAGAEEGKEGEAGKRALADVVRTPRPVGVLVSGQPGEAALDGGL